MDATAESLNRSTTTRRLPYGVRTTFTRDAQKRAILFFESFDARERTKENKKKERKEIKKKKSNACVNPYL